MTTATLLHRTAKDPATNGQKLTIRGLLKTRRWETVERADGIQRGVALMNAGQLKEDGAAWMIRALRACPVCRNPDHGRRPRPSDVKIPDGHYMIDDRRFRVTTPTDGKWAGRISLREQFTDGSETYLRNPERTQILAWIASDPTGAAQEYGRRTGRCGYCHKKLFRQKWVDLGVGQDCAKEHGII